LLLWLDDEEDEDDEEDDEEDEDEDALLLWLAKLLWLLAFLWLVLLWLLCVDWLLSELLWLLWSLCDLVLVLDFPAEVLPGVPPWKPRNTSLPGNNAGEAIGKVLFNAAVLFTVLSDSICGFSCCCWLDWGAIVGVDDNGLITGLLIGAIAADVVATLLLVVVIWCCFEVGGDTRLFAVDFAVWRGITDDDTDDVDGVPANEGFTVLGIPHICASVVLTTLRAGLLGSHILALTSGDITLLSTADEDDCCAYTWILLQTPKINTPARTVNITKNKLA
jgi:hypothetical protein